MQVPGILPRLLALVYETVLVAALLMVAGFVFQPLHGVLTASLARGMQSLFLLLVLALYFGWCWLCSGQTLALKTWRMRLVAPDGRPVDLRAAVLRFVLGLLLYLPLLATIVWWVYQRQQALPYVVLMLVLWLVNWGWALIDGERQLLLDRLAGTRLIKVS
jgi:uncharacterized RDD family membrane protein YckC